VGKRLENDHAEEKEGDGGVLLIWALRKYKIVKMKDRWNLLKITSSGRFSFRNAEPSGFAITD
jgi:hypothetical protein